MTDEEITHKFDRVCAYMHVSNRSSANAGAHPHLWCNLRRSRTVRSHSTFGRPQACDSDKGMHAYQASPCRHDVDRCRIGDACRRGQ